MAINRIQLVENVSAPSIHNRIAETAVEASAATAPTGFVGVFIPVLSLVAMQQRIYQLAYAKAVEAYQPRWMRNDWHSVN